MKPSYFAVIWGDELENEEGESIPTSGPASDPTYLRVVFVKTDSPYKACKQCYGLVAKNMWIKDLGIHIAPLRTNWRRAQLLSSTHGTWMRVHKEGVQYLLNGEEVEPLFWVDVKIKELA